MFLAWPHNIIRFSLKCYFCNFSWKNIASIHFYLLVLTLNQENVFSNPHSLLRDITMLSLFIGKVALEVPHGKYRLKTFPLPSFELKARKQVSWSCDNVIMTSQDHQSKIATRYKPFSSSDTCGTMSTLRFRIIVPPPSPRLLIFWNFSTREIFIPTPLLLILRIFFSFKIFFSFLSMMRSETF